MTFPALAELLPHSPPMVLLDQIRSWENDRACCVVVLGPDSLFVENGRVRAVVALEYMAQCVGVCTSLRAMDAGQPLRNGYLVGARELRLLTDTFAVGDVLEVEAAVRFDGEELGTFDCSVLRHGVLVAQATLSVYRTDCKECKAS